MAAITAGGVRFHVQRLEPEAEATGRSAQSGARHAPTVVFVHGLAMDNLSSFYYTLAGPVAAAGARVLLYDLRGHGNSQRTPRGYTTADGAADLCALLDALGVDEPVYLVGNSYGGLVCARTALLAPSRVAGMALIETACAGEGAATWLEDMVNSLTVGALSLAEEETPRRFREAGDRKMARVTATADALLNHTTIIEDLASERPLAPADLSRISCPVLGVYGECSDLAGSAADLARYLPGCQVELVGGLAHTVLLDATGPLRDLLLDWLRRTVADQAGPSHEAAA